VRSTLRPERVVVVCGTGTEVGKTWVACAVLRGCRQRGHRVAARKPAQSFDGTGADGSDATEPTDATDAEALAAASGEDAAVVCLPHRSFDVAMAPPMAAELLGRPSFTLDDLVSELAWPAERVDLGVVELAGGVRSPQAADGDATHLTARLRPDAVVLVSDAGLGTINAVRLSVAALAGVTEGTGAPAAEPLLVVLDRFDEGLELHRRNREWLAGRDGHRVLVVPGDEAELVDALLEVPVRPAGGDRGDRGAFSPDR